MTVLRGHTFFLKVTELIAKEMMLSSGISDSEIQLQDSHCALEAQGIFKNRDI